MPFVRRLILKGENNWNGSTAFRLVCLLWTIPPPSSCRLRGKRMTKNRFIIIIFLVYQFRIAGRQPISIVSALLVLNSVAVPLEQSGFGRKHVTWPAIDRSCCIDQSLMQSYLNYSSARPILMRFLPHQRSSADIAAVPLLFYVCFSNMFRHQTDAALPQDKKIKSVSISLHMGPYLFLDSDLLTAQISGHMFSATTRSLMVVAFIFAA